MRTNPTPVAVPIGMQSPYLAGSPLANAVFGTGRGGPQANLTNMLTQQEQALKKQQASKQAQIQERTARLARGRIGWLGGGSGEAGLLG